MLNLYNRIIANTVDKVDCLTEAYPWVLLSDVVIVGACTYYRCFPRFVSALYWVLLLLLCQSSSCRFLSLVQKMLLSLTRCFYLAEEFMRSSNFVKNYLQTSHLHVSNTFDWGFSMMQKLKFDAESGMHVLETLPENINVGSYVFSFEVVTFLLFHLRHCFISHSFIK